MSPRVLFIFTSASRTLKDNNCGWYLPEAAHPYYILGESCDVRFAAPAGPNPPIDQSSVEQSQLDIISTQFLEDPGVKSKLASAKRLADTDPNEYDALFYIGGHGPALDLAADPANVKLATAIWDQNKPIAALCHGPAALVGVMDPNGRSIFEGKEVVSFSNAEEVEAGKVADIPFLVESRIKELGGKYVCAQPWSEKVVASGNLLTGQNPASASPLAKALLARLVRGTDLKT